MSGSRFWSLSQPGQANGVGRLRSGLAGVVACEKSSEAISPILFSRVSGSGLGAGSGAAKGGGLGQGFGLKVKVKRQPGRLKVAG